MDFYFEQLKNIDLAKSSPELVEDIINHLPILLVPFIIPVNGYILRSRKGWGLKTREEIKYPPVENCDKIQRATLSGNTMFYGTISYDQSHQEYARAISVSEISTLARMGRDSIGRETFSVSFWQIIEQLHVISLITPSAFLETNNNKLLNLLRDSFNQCWGGDKSTKEEKEIADFVSKEFCKIVNSNNDNEYLISATIATNLLKSNKYDGIIYPSVQVNGQCGVNIALTTEAADNKLKFIKVADSTLYKNKENSFIVIDNITENGITKTISQIENHNIKQILHIDDINKLPIIT